MSLLLLPERREIEMKMALTDGNLPRRLQNKSFKATDKGPQKQMLLRS